MVAGPFLTVRKWFLSTGMNELLQGFCPALLACDLRIQEIAAVFLQYTLIWNLSTHLIHTHTQLQGYEPVIFYPKRTSKLIYQILVTQCEKLNIPFIDNLPSAAEIDSEYHVIVDAVFGFSFKGTPRSPFDAVLATLKQVKKPLAAVDIPSGRQFTLIGS